jgi:hypothetical protein
LPQTLFYITLLPFIAFYFSFSFFLYPFRNYLHPMHIPLPAGGAAFGVNLIRHWTFSLYYIVSDVWGSVGIPLLFWKCANDVVSLHEVCLLSVDNTYCCLHHASAVPVCLQSKRFYPIMAVMSNLGPIVSGLLMSTVGTMVGARIADKDKAFEVSLKIVSLMMTGAGGVVAALHWVVHRIADKEAAARISLPREDGRMPAEGGEGNRVEALTMSIGNFRVYAFVTLLIVRCNRREKGLLNSDDDHNDHRKEEEEAVSTGVIPCLVARSIHTQSRRDGPVLWAGHRVH